MLYLVEQIWGLIERTAGWLAHHEEEVTAPAKRNDMDRQRFAEELEQIKRRRAAVAREREMVAERRGKLPILEEEDVLCVVLIV